MKNPSNYLIAALSLILVSACEKKENDTEKPNIEIINPANHADYVIGDTIKIQIKFTDDTELKTVSFKMNEENSANNIIEINKTISSKSFQIDTSYIVTTANTFDLDFTIEAFDKSGNTRLKTQHAHCNE